MSKELPKGEMIAASPQSSESSPAPFLEVRVNRMELVPALVGLCVGYESGQWRSKQLVDHMMEWLPDFALNYTERKSINSSNAVRLIRAAAKSIYKTDKFKKRGEFGELLLHIAIRQVYETIPAISKLYYKDASNDTVKGFDAVHVIWASSALELWLGEAKFYDDISAAIADVVAELEKHTQDEYLRGEFAAIVNKIDPKWPHAGKLKALLDQNTSLDQVFETVCIPVLLTYDSKTVNSHDRVSPQYVQEFTTEVEKHHATFASKNLPRLRIHLFLIPLKSKSELLAELDAGLKKWQNI